MNFAQAKTAVRLGMQVRFLDEYGAYPHHVPAGTTGTVVDNRLDAIDPVIEVRLDDPDLVPWGRIDIRGPEEAFPVGIKELALDALAYDPTDKRHGGREAEGDEGTFQLDDRYKIGRWGNPVPFEIVDPPASSAETRRAALAYRLKQLEDADYASRMSDNRYAVSGRMDRATTEIRALKAALAEIT